MTKNNLKQIEKKKKYEEQWRWNSTINNKEVLV